MNTQPEALRLAEQLDGAPYSSFCTNEAAAELRRLYKENIALRQAIELAEHEREAIYHIVSHAPFTEAFDDGELESEIGDALKSMAFTICAAIRARGEQA